jgi:hypothetical protein
VYWPLTMMGAGETAVQTAVEGRDRLAMQLHIAIERPRLFRGKRRWRWPCSQ